MAMLVLVLLKPTLLAMIPADLPRLSEVHYDSRVLGLAFLLSLGTGLLFGLTPALQASSFDPNRDLKEGGRSGGSSRRQNRFRSVLVFGEIALSVVLSIGAGLLIHSFWGMLQVSPGMDPKNVILARIWIPVPNNPQANRYLKREQREILMRELLRRMNSLAGVQDAAMGSGSTIPFLSHVRNPFSFAMPDARAGNQREVAEFAAVSPNYLRVLRAPLMSGRFFTDRDSANSKRVVVVDEAFVRRYVPDRRPIGRHMLAGLQFRDWEIVGVVGDLHGDGLDSPALPHVYFSIYQNSNFELAVFLRTRRDTNELNKAVSQAVHSVDPELPVYGVRTMRSLMFASMEARRFSLSLVSVTAALALLLAAIGIYGLMALAVNQRMQEFGIRMALGARGRDVVVAAVWPGIVLTLLGDVAGLALAAVSMRGMSSLLFGVLPNDPATFTVIPVVLGTVALAACFIPARRAARISAVEAIRH